MLNTSTAVVTLVTPQAGMFDAWFALYERYAATTGVQTNRHIGGVLWRWLLDGTYRVAGTVAVDAQKRLVGFVHYRPYPNTLDGSEACWIDDLYVADDLRESGVAERLIEHVCMTARKRGWTEVGWTRRADASDDASFAHAAVRTDAVAYRIKLGS